MILEILPACAPSSGLCLPWGRGFNRTVGETPEESGTLSTGAPGTSFGGSHRLLEFDSGKISSPFLLMARV